MSTSCACVRELEREQERDPVGLRVQHVCFLLGRWKCAYRYMPKGKKRRRNKGPGHCVHPPPPNKGGGEAGDKARFDSIRFVDKERPPRLAWMRARGRSESEDLSERQI